MARSDLQARLDERRAAHLYRRRRVLDGPQGPEIEVDGRRLLAFCSNDYLGLASHPEVARAFQRGIETYGTGSGAAHLVTGHSRAHHALEEELAEFTGRPRALLFSTGYMANLGVVGALTGRGDRVFEDRFNHASLLDAARMSGGKLVRYRHLDMAELHQRLTSAGFCEYLVATDGVFSMDGDLAPLPELARMAEGHGAWLLVDDAHGLGVLGEQGSGSLSHWQVAGEPVILMGTLGKAFGTFGAFVAADAAVIETLIQQARTYVYTTALPPALAEATRAALRLVRDGDDRRAHLRALVARFRAGAEQLGLDLLASETPIQPVVIGEPGTAVAASEALRERGILVPAMRPPTVPERTARLRITFSAAHTEAQVDRLLEALEAVLGAPPVAG